MDLAAAAEDVESRVRRLAPLVTRIAKHIAASVPEETVERDRLIRAGMAGLMDVARRAGSCSDARFEALATERIRHEMIEALRGYTALPREIRHRMRDVETTISKLTRRRRRPPSEREIASAMGMSVTEYQRLLQDAQGYQIVSYDDIGLGAPAAAPDVAPAETDPLELLQDPKLRDAIVKAIEALPEEERFVLGLYLEHRLNHAEIAAVLGHAEARVSQLYTQAIARIRVAIQQR